MNVIGVDVGSGSVRAVLTRIDDGVASVLSTHSVKTTTYNPKQDFYEQNSQEVWGAVVEAMKSCLTEGRTDQVNGIAFTATCSLVIVQSTKTRTCNDIIMWMDHRAVDQADIITKTGHERLRQSGRVCSPEFSLAKILWLKDKMTSTYNDCQGFLELPDYLTWRCLDVAIRQFAPSNCSATCKWFFDAESFSWNHDFMGKVGLSELFQSPEKIGKCPVLPGTFVGFMSDVLKKELGIRSSCDVSVASSIIDAHSGVLGMVTLFTNYYQKKYQRELDVQSILTSIVGTSTCHMVLTNDRRETDGVWGPYLNVVTVGHYVREPGQSATGKLIDHIIENHPDRDKNFSRLNNSQLIVELNKILAGTATGGNKLVVNPSFHGNRCPLADPTLRGGIYGLDLNGSRLVDVYEATIESLIYETKFIVEELKMPELKVILASGGLTKNSFFVQTYADVMAVDVVSMDCGSVDMMLVGTAIMAYQAIKKESLHLESMKDVDFKDLSLTIFRPRPETRSYHERKYKAYRLFISASQDMQKILNDIN